MAVNYSAALKSTRMAAVITAIDASGAGSHATLEICTAAFAAVIVAITLDYPSFTESGGVITLANVPKSADATLAGTNTAAVARIKTGGGTTVVNNLSVGVGTGDIQLNSTSITQGQSVSITAGTITHAA